MFDALSPLGEAVASAADWPTAEELTQLAAKESARRGVWMPTFVEQLSQRQLRAKERGPRQRSSLYDARIIEAGEVPTRPRHWHDVMNALAWMAFPLTKRAIHRRQYELLCAAVGPSFEALPSARTKEHDAVAMLDEGGALVLCPDESRASVELSVRTTDRSTLENHCREGRALLFVLGHGILESVVLAGAFPPVHALTVVISSPSLPRSLAASRAVLDESLAEALDSRALPASHFERPNEPPPRGLLLDEALFACVQAKA